LRNLIIQPILIAALLRINTRFANGEIATEQDLEMMTVAGFEQMAVHHEGNNGTLHQTNSNSDLKSKLTDPEMKLWKQLKRSVRNRKSAANSRNEKSKNGDRVQDELAALKLRHDKVIHTLSTIVASHQMNSDNIIGDLQQIIAGEKVQQ